MKKSIFCRVVSLALVLCVLMGCVPAGAETTGLISAYEKIADPSTMDAYKEYFTVDTTEYAGLVWTDKSVFASAEDFAAATENKRLPAVYCAEHTNTPHKTMGLMDDRNFLVALSAAASNKSISGYTVKPTDTVFVLDVSNSMWEHIEDDTKRTERRIENLIPAANEAIDTLLKLNNNNRIAVVLFSGLRTNARGSSPANDKENSAQVLLPLGRYTPASGKNYLSLNFDNTESEKDLRYTVTPHSGLKQEDGGSVAQSSKYVNGATYIQDGLYMAWNNVFKNANTTVQGTIQQGVEYLPVLILMGDGAPTSATTEFAPENAEYIGDSNAGDGALSHNTGGEAFLTQLTASWVKNQIDGRYNKETPLFYTIGVGLNENTTTANNYWARHVMDPMYTPLGSATTEEKNIKTTFDRYWSEYLSGSVTLNLTEASFITTPPNYNRYNKTIEKDPNAVNRNYVDGYYEVNDTSRLTDTFNNIVEEIKFQSRYKPTDIKKEDPFGIYSGYVTFIDDIGEHMEIKDVKGLVIKDRLYSGEHMASMFTAENMTDWFSNQDIGTPAENHPGYQLITAMVNRLGLLDEPGKEKNGRYLACALIDAAYNANQLGPKAHTGSDIIGNSVGWYADEDGKILTGYVGNTNTPVAFWDWENESEQIPRNAAYRVRSYIFYDELHDPDKPFDGAVTNKNSIYVSVQVRQHIATEEVSLVWRIPSELIPINEYSIALNEDESVQSVKMIKVNPLQLVYEVGMKDGYRSHEIEETVRQLSGFKAKDKEEFDEWLKMDEAGRDAEHDSTKELTDIESLISDEDGNYYFYTNAFDLHIHPDDLTEHPSQKINTVSYFEPSTENERFRFTKETDILIKGNGATAGFEMEDAEGNKYVKYTGNNKPTLSSIAEEGYYFKRNVFVHEGSRYRIAEKAASIRQPSLEKAVKRNDGSWYIPVGVIEYPQERVQNLKNSNLTETYEYSDIATVEIAGKNYDIEHIQQGNYIISSILGNNGRLKVIPDTGIALRKDTSGGAGNEQFIFTITRTDEEETADRQCRVIRKAADGEETGPVSASFKNGVLKVDVAAGELVRILDLPDGAVYTITEESGFGHKLETITVMTKDDAQPVEVLEATDIKITAGSQVHVAFKNVLPPAPAQSYGMLALRKIVSHNYKYGFDIPMDKEFIFRLTFDKHVNDVLYDTEGKAYELDQNGSVKNNVLLKPNQEIVFTGLAEGTKVTVEEIIGPHESYVVEEIIATADGVDVKADNMVQVGVKGGEKASVTVHNKYLEPYLPSTGDNSRLILWTALLGVCAVSALLLRRRREN